MLAPACVHCVVKHLNRSQQWPLPCLLPWALACARAPSALPRPRLPSVLPCRWGDGRAWAANEAGLGQPRQWRLPQRFRTRRWSSSEASAACITAPINACAPPWMPAGDQLAEGRARSHCQHQEHAEDHGGHEAGGGSQGSPCTGGGDQWAPLRREPCQGRGRPACRGSSWPARRCGRRESDVSMPDMQPGRRGKGTGALV